MISDNDTDVVQFNFELEDVEDGIQDLNCSTTYLTDACNFKNQLNGGGGGKGGKASPVQYGSPSICPSQPGGKGKFF